MNLTCYIRRTKEWADNYMISSERYLTKPWNVNRLARIWNETFTTSYIDFRKQLGQIQQENLQEIAFNKVINQYEYVEDDAIVVPTDDDDWFHPDIVNKLRSECKPVMHWNFVNYQYGVISIHRYPSNYPFIFESNNYSLIKPIDHGLLKDHTQADNKLRDVGFYIDACLSMHNRSIASVSLLGEHLRSSKNNHKAKLLELYELHKRPLTIADGVPSYFMKYVDKMLYVYRNDLKPRKSFL